MTKSSKTDIHLSAYRISPETIPKLEASGLSRDNFANNTRCDVTAYHATARGERHLSADQFWNQLRAILEADPLFVGGLEEEVYAPDETIQFNGQATDVPSAPAPALTMAQPPAGKYKACDIHINLDLSRTTEAALGFVEALELASFDRSFDENLHRIFSATCETVDAGRMLFDQLSVYFRRIPGLVGKMKFERITRFLRLPESAPVLPLASEASVSAWLRACEERGYQ